MEERIFLLRVLCYVCSPCVLQDGGLLLNNPSALAMHECKCLWPDVPLECIVSLGTGRYESDVRNTTTYTSLKTKLSNVINSATDTEGQSVYVLPSLTLPSGMQFRVSSRSEWCYVCVVDLRSTWKQVLCRFCFS